MTIRSSQDFMESFKAAQRWLPVVAVVALVVTGSVLTINSLVDSVRDDKLSAVRTIRDASIHSIVTWSQAQAHTVETWAKSTEVKTEVERLTAIHRSGGSTSDPGLQRALNDFLGPVAIQRSYLAHYIVTPDGTCIASDEPQSIGPAHPLNDHENLLECIVSGVCRVAVPFKSPVPLQDESGEMVEGLPTLLIGAPVLDENGRTLAALFFRLDPSFTFTRIMQRGRIGETGETYGFDADANMVSDSRFCEQLRRAGLIGKEQDSILNLLVKDPGADLIKGFEASQSADQMPPTYAVASAIQGYSGEDGFGYRDYRGVEVIGAWDWIEEMGMGITTEIDTEEAFALLYKATVTIWMLAVAISLSIVVVWHRAIKNKKKIEDSERRFRTATQCVTDLVYVLDYRDGSFTWHGDAVSLLGIADIKSISTIQGIIDRIHPDDRLSFELEREASAESGGVIEWVGRIVPDSGEDAYWDLRSVSLSGDPKDPRRVGALTNVTDMMTQQVLAKKARATAEEVSRAKSQFLATISHELRTPLNVIVGMHDLLLYEELSERQSEYIIEASKQTRQLTQIVDSVMQFTQLDSESYKKHEEPLRPDDVVESAFRPFVEQAKEKGLTALCKIDEDVPAIVVGDIVLISWAVRIMSDNAVKFTDEGSVSVALSVAEQSDSHCLLSISVTDTGCGIPAEMQEEIFNQFTQSDSSPSRPKGGTGLGLAVLQIIASHLRGRVEVQSELGKGSTFTLYARLLRDRTPKELSIEPQARRAK